MLKKFNLKDGEKLTQLYLKSDVLLLSCVFENFIKVSFEEYRNNPLYCVSLPGYTWQCGSKYKRINLKTIQDKDLNLTLENIIRGGIKSVMGERYVKSDENKKVIYMDAANLYGHSISQPLPYGEIEMGHGHPDVCMIKLEENLNTPDDSAIGIFVRIYLRYPDNIKEKTKMFPICPKNKFIPKDKYKAYIKK